jgi:demethylmenaquinone methyltransferase/2-methoxy-6-polyprenyl-1,4-benzoquinol methylase
MYNRYGLLYDFIGGQFERPYTMIGIKLLCVKQNDHVLEIGFGTGHALVALAKAVGENGKVTGIDISERMCTISFQRIEQAGVSDRIQLHCGDALPLPFGKAVFDKVLMSFTLELFDTPDIPLLLRECLRVLKPEGRICVVSLAKTRKASLIERLYEWIHRLFPHWVDCRPIRPVQELSEVGFKVIKDKTQPMFGLNVGMVVAIKPIL